MRSTGQVHTTPQCQYDGNRDQCVRIEGDVAVTTMTIASSIRRIAPTAAATLCLGVLLAGCESSSSLFATNTPPDASLASQGTAPTPVLTRVSIAPVIGAPDQVARQLQQEFTTALDKSKVSVVNAGDTAQYTLRGYIVASKEKTTTKLSYIWDVNDAGGKRVNRITGEDSIAGASGKDPWSQVTPAVTLSIAQKSAASFGAWLPSTPPQAAIATLQTPSTPVGVGAAGSEPGAVALNSPPAATSTQGLRPQLVSAPGQTTGSINRDTVTAIVPSVSGAPGDGSSALTTALQAELSKNGVALAEQSSPSTYRVEGNVKVGQARDGKQAVQIDWQVKDPNGKKVGSVSQKNEIPEGSLDGAWGRTADAAAAAAAQGILKLLPAKAVN
jgi:hypothetical protein